MTRQDSLWVAIRSFGIYLLVHALFAIPATISATADFIEIQRIKSEQPHLSGATPPEAAQALTYWHGIEVNNTGLFFGSLARFVLYGAAGLYMIRDGKLLFKWINPPDKTEPPV